MMNAIEKFNINAVEVSDDESEATLVVDGPGTMREKRTEIHSQ